jgi:hypothetical protein
MWTGDRSVPFAAPVQSTQEGIPRMEVRANRSVLKGLQVESVLDALGTTRVALHVSTEQLLDRTAVRAVRARLALVGVPLVMVAALLKNQWWALVPLASAAWWLAPSEWGWEWLMAVGRGLLAAEWAGVGAGALAAFPDNRLDAGVVWIALPAALALYAAFRPSRRN